VQGAGAELGGWGMPNTIQFAPRYEAPYRFEVPFTVAITQGGKQVFSRVYGRRTNLKVWGVAAARQKGGICKPGLTTECVWSVSTSQLTEVP
jgi:hypothetical protein